MWIIGPSGFISIVQDNTNPDLIRVRARRREHLIDTFESVRDGDIIDLGPNAPDYRWHCSLPRTMVAAAMYDTIMNDVTYVSHVKEQVAGDDDVFYRAMLQCWTALHRLQDPPAPEGDWWTDPEYWRCTAITAKGVRCSREVSRTGAATCSQHAPMPMTDEEWEPFLGAITEHVPSPAERMDAIVGQVHDLADKMRHDRIESAVDRYRATKPTDT